MRFDDNPPWEPQPEDAAVAQARAHLLSLLEEAGEALPGDRWILGQRVRYLGDEGRWAEAEAIAGSCEGDPLWWCSALQGYILHRRGDAVASLQAFSRALTEMSPSQAEEWLDPYPLLDYPEKNWVREPEGLSRGEAVARFWRLADPLFLTPGNERLSEHFARRFAATLYEGSAVTIGLPWNTGLESLLLRYGFVAGWERSRPGLENGPAGSVIEHHHPDSRGLLPPFEALADPSSLSPDEWRPRDDHPRSTSAPVLAPLVAEGSAQVAVLRRGPNLLVLAAYGPPQDTVLLRRRPSPSSQAGEARARRPTPRPAPWEPSAEGRSSDTLSGLFLVADTGRWAPLAAFGRGGQGVLQLLAPPGGYLVSVELWNPGGRWGARVREGVHRPPLPPDVPALSDLLLLDARGPPPESLEDAKPRLRTGTTLARGDSLVVGWEVYGLGRRREPLSFRLRLARETGSAVRRALERLGLFRRPPALTLSWSEPGPEKSLVSGAYFRAVHLDLPPLEAGTYVLRLEMALPYRARVSSERRITVF